MKEEPCALCHRVGCDCDAKNSPWNVYDHYNISCGSFTTLDLAVAGMKLINSCAAGPAKLFNRYSLPVEIAL